MTDIRTVEICKRYIFEKGFYRTSDYNTFAEALFDIEDGDKTLFVDSIIDITETTTIPSNITINVLGGGGFTSSNTSSLVINGPFECGNSQCFFGDVVVTFGKINKVQSAWWGDIGDNATDNATAIQSAINSMAAAAAVSGEVEIGNGTHIFNTMLSITTDRIKIKGQGRDTTVLKPSTSLATAIKVGTGIANPVNNVVFEDFTLEGNSNVTSGACGILLHGSNNTSFKNIDVQNFIGLFSSSDARGRGVEVFARNTSDGGGGYYARFDGCKIEYNNYGVYGRQSGDALNYPNYPIFIDTYIQRNLYFGIYFDVCYGLQFFGGQLTYNADYPINIRGNATVITSPNLEDNPPYGQHVIMTAGGYVNAVAGDIGKTCTGGTSGSTGRLLSYNNGTRDWEILNAVNFSAGETITVTGGTGVGIYSSVTSNRATKDAIFLRTLSDANDSDITTFGLSAGNIIGNSAHQINRFGINGTQISKLNVTGEGGLLRIEEDGGRQVIVLKNSTDAESFSLLCGTGGGGSLNVEGNNTLSAIVDSSTRLTLTNALLTVTTPVLGQSSIKSSHDTLGIGYSTGAGGTVTQTTSKSTGVTLNKINGEITLNNAALAAGAVVSFTLTNSAIAATDFIHLKNQLGGTAGAYMFDYQCAAGSAVITVRNLTAGSLSEAIVLGFAVLKGVTS
jgi:hypothetical protein